MPTQERANKDFQASERQVGDADVKTIAMCLWAGLVRVACGEQVVGGVKAPRNPNQVPSVIGKSVQRAALTLEPVTYGCGIIDIHQRDSLPGGRVLEQTPDAGSRGPLGQLVRVVVSGPYDLKAMPANCMDRTKGS